MDTITTFPTAPLGYTPSNTVAYSQVVATQTGIVSSADLTGLSVTVSVPEGRRIRITGHVGQFSKTAGTVTYIILAVQEGSYWLGQTTASVNNNYSGVEISTIITPTAGTHTYKLGAYTDGTIQAEATNGNPAYILVEDITGQPSAVSPASIPVGILAQALNFGGGTVSTVTDTLVSLSTLNISVPAGRTLRLSGKIHVSCGTAGDRTRVVFREASTVLAAGYRVLSGGSFGEEILIETLISPTAGAHTYELAFARNSGSSTHTVYSIASEPTLFSVEDITPTPAAANNAPSSTLAYAERTVQQTGISAEADLTNLTVTVNIAAGRRLKISAAAQVGNDTNASFVLGRIKQDNVEIGRWMSGEIPASSWRYGEGSTIVSPSAGSHTYKLTLQKWSGAGTILLDGSTSFPAFILVEDITGTGLAHSHDSSPSSTLAYTEITSSSTSATAGTTVDVPGLTATVTVLAGRRLRIAAKFIGYANTLPARVAATIREGSTVLGNFEAQPTQVGMGVGLHAEAIVSPSAGTHTYKVSITAATNTGFVYVDATGLAGWLLVEDITGTGVSGHTHSELDDTGWIYPTLLNSWVNYDGSAGGYSWAKYRKIGKVVYVSGLVKSGTIGANVFDLPVGFRPIRNLHFATASNAAFGIVEICSSVGGPGSVKANTGSNVWISLECSFPADQ